LTVNAAGRGYVGTQVAHLAGAAIRHAPDFNTIDEANRVVNLMTAKGHILGHDGSLPQVLAAPSLGQVMTGKPAATLGWVFDWFSIPHFASVAARTAAIGAPAEGMMSILDDTGRIDRHDGTNWVTVAWGEATGRIGVQLRQVATQNYLTNTTAFLAWDTEDFDPDGFHAGTSTDIIVPTGLAGIYSGYARLVYSGAITAPLSVEWVVNGAGGGMMTQAVAASSRMSVALGPVALAAGQALQVQVRNASGNPTVGVTGTVEVYRMGL
jgi:hypothetical protein